jgi:REP element-mobilizing transposase RayT
MEKFKNKYRIPSARLRDWDYGSPGLYFITICTHDRKNFFGEIKNGEMFLNENGTIADNCWSEIVEHFKNVDLGEFVIMPNHVHGIVIINENAETGYAVEKGYTLSLQSNSSTHFRFRNQGKNTISAMVGSFKSAVTKLANRRHKSCLISTPEIFGWQTRFYDHIIRTKDEYILISKYIINNIANWKEDKFYTL